MSSSGLCPENFKDIYPGSDYCYMINADEKYSHRKSWGDADVECMAYGGRLASIHSVEEMMAIKNEIQDKYTDVWIGLQLDSK